MTVGTAGGRWSSVGGVCVELIETPALLTRSSSVDLFKTHAWDCRGRVRSPAKLDLQRNRGSSARTRRVRCTGIARLLRFAA